MTVQTVVHLNFRGDAREALEFYRDVTGGDLAMFTYEDAGRVTDPAEATQVVWGQVTAPGGFHVMAFDVPAARPFDRGTASFYVSVRGQSVEEVEALWKGLADGATIDEDFGPSGWSPAYGMLTDRFGVTWVLDVEATY